jgi:hypothetical protein
VEIGVNNNGQRTARLAVGDPRRHKPQILSSHCNAGFDRLSMGEALGNLLDSPVRSPDVNLM